MYWGSNDVKSYNAVDKNKSKSDEKSKDSKESKNKDSYNSLLRGLRKSAQFTAFGVATCAFFTSSFGNDVIDGISEKLIEKGCDWELSRKVAISLTASAAVAGSVLAASL